MRTIAAVMGFAVALFSAVPVFPQEQKVAVVNDGTHPVPFAVTDARALPSADVLPDAVHAAFEESVVRVCIYRKIQVFHFLKVLGCATGFVVASHKVLTRYHVVSGRGAVVRVTKGGLDYRARVLRLDEDIDLAIVRVEDRKHDPFFYHAADISLDPLITAPSAHFFTFGFRLRKNERFYIDHDRFSGYLPLPEYTWNVPDGVTGTLHLKAQPGFSGSPVVDDQGRVRGIVWGMADYARRTDFTPARVIKTFLLTDERSPFP